MVQPVARAWRSLEGLNAGGFSRREVAGSMVKLLGLGHFGGGCCILMGEGPLSKERLVSNL